METLGTLCEESGKKAPHWKGTSYLSATIMSQARVLTLGISNYLYGHPFYLGGG